MAPAHTYTQRRHLLPLYTTLWALICLTLSILTGCEQANPEISDAEIGDAEISDGAPCAPGALGCACGEAGECPEGRCAEGLCVACPEGALRCPCAAGEICGEGLICEADLCVEDAPCPPGAVDCPCDGGACDEGLICVDESCIEISSCPPGAADCPCDGGACDDPLVCINDLCRDCPPDEVGCPCHDGACDGGLICDTGACRAPGACADAGCGPQQLCEAPAGGDAECLEACVEGFAWDPVEGRCVERTPSCDPGALGSVAGRCAEAHRICVPDEGGAACGACLAGFVEQDERCVRDAQATCDGAGGIGAACAADNRACVGGAEGAICGDCLEGFVIGAGGECQPLAAFEACDAASDCPEGTVCSARAPAEDARCLPPICAPEQALDLRLGVCTDRCGCEGPGLTGRPWPVTDWNGDCVCETEPGFFFNTSIGSRQAEPCDGDGDGWTRRSAFVHVESPDEAIRLNARCEVRTIDQVVLVNERGQSLPLSMRTLSNGAVEFEPLYETDESDDEAEALERQSAPYGSRKLHAAELNPMTKACVTALDDLNDNGISDLREHQRATPGRRWMSTFVAAGYFVELYTGRYEGPAAGDLHGRYVITERSRCDEGAFALNYGPDEGPYGRECMRRRDRGYDAAEPVGYDFQRWSCPEGDGACPVSAPPVAQLSVDAVVPHGLCDSDPAEDPVPWRGMGHANQFKCVEIVSDLQTPVADFQRPRRLIKQAAGSDARLTLNTCGLARCPEGAPGCDEGGVELNPREPRLSCESDVTVVVDDPEALVGQVGWVALGFEDYEQPDAYAGGCINEQVEWPTLCPGFDPEIPSATIGQGNPGNFGKIICGCGLNYGGPGCDQGCPDAELHVGGDGAAADGCVNGYCLASPDESGLEGGRSGVWLCGDFSATTYAEAHPEQGGALTAVGAIGAGEGRLEGVITVRGRIPVMGTDGALMCQSVDEAGRCLGVVAR